MFYGNQVYVYVILNSVAVYMRIHRSTKVMGTEKLVCA